MSKRRIPEEFETNDKFVLAPQVKRHKPSNLTTKKLPQWEIQAPLPAFTEFSPFKLGPSDIIYSASPDGIYSFDSYTNEWKLMVKVHSNILKRGTVCQIAGDAAQNKIFVFTEAALCEIDLDDLINPSNNSLHSTESDEDEDDDIKTMDNLNLTPFSREKRLKIMGRPVCSPVVAHDGLLYIMHLRNESIIDTNNNCEERNENMFADEHDMNPYYCTYVPKTHQIYTVSERRSMYGCDHEWGHVDRFDVAANKAHYSSTTYYDDRRFSDVTTMSKSALFGDCEYHSGFAVNSGGNSMVMCGGEVEYPSCVLLDHDIIVVFLDHPGEKFKDSVHNSMVFRSKVEAPVDGPFHSVIVDLNAIRTNCLVFGYIKRRFQKYKGLRLPSTDIFNMIFKYTVIPYLHVFDRDSVQHWRIKYDDVIGNLTPYGHYSLPDTDDDNPYVTCCYTGEREQLRCHSCDVETAIPCSRCDRWVSQDAYDNGIGHAYYLHEVNGRQVAKNSKSNCFRCGLCDAESSDDEDDDLENKGGN